MGLTYDDFIRTTEPRHKRGVQKLFATSRARRTSTSLLHRPVLRLDELFVERPPGTLPRLRPPTETVTEENYFFKLSAT
jgi:methionyl-tRNA synthetase